LADFGVCFAALAAVLGVDPGLVCTRTPSRPVDLELEDLGVPFCVTVVSTSISDSLLLELSLSELSEELELFADEPSFLLPGSDFCSEAFGFSSSSSESLVEESELLLLLLFEVETFAGAFLFSLVLALDFGVTVRTSALAAPDLVEGICSPSEEESLELELLLVLSLAFEAVF